jgi:hypothetical protein
VDAWNTVLVKRQRPALARNVTQSCIGIHMPDDSSLAIVAIVVVVLVYGLYRRLDVIGTAFLEGN